MARWLFPSPVVTLLPLSFQVRLFVILGNGALGAFLISAVPGLNRVAQAATSGEPFGDDAE